MSGVPSMSFVALSIVFARIKDLLSTMHWSGNLRRVGAGAVVQSGVTIRYPAHVELGERASISRGVEMSSEFPDSFCVLGDRIIVGRDVRLDFSGGLKVGDDTVISEGTTIFTHSHGLDPKSDPVKKPLRIGEKVWIGAGVLIVEGVGAIGDGAVVAAGSVVTKEVQPFTLVAGVPAKVVRSIATASQPAS